MEQGRRPMSRRLKRWLRRQRVLRREERAEREREKTLDYAQVSHMKSIAKEIQS